MPKNSVLHQAGYLAVDSGMVSLGDPLFYSEANTLYNDWETLSERVEMESKNNVFVHDRDYVGMVINHGVDGEYPVFVECHKDTGKLLRVIIDFTEDNERSNAN